MLHVQVELGKHGATLVLAASKGERSYRLACIEALQAGKSMPDADTLPSIVASYVRYWAVQAYGRADAVADGDTPVYHVPARGWALLHNGISLVICSKQHSPITRVAAVFEAPLKEPVKVSAMLVLSKQPKGWLATFREQKEEE